MNPTDQQKLAFIHALYRAMYAAAESDIPLLARGEVRDAVEDSCKPEADADNLKLFNPLVAQFGPMLERWAAPVGN